MLSHATLILASQTAVRRRELLLKRAVVRLLPVVLFATLAGVAQDPLQDQKQQNEAQPSSKIPRVTTTVEVHARLNESYEVPVADVDNLDGAVIPLRELPLSVSIASRGLLNDLNARVLADVVKTDASIGEDYAPIGYYGDFQIRGFPLDLATAIQINGLPVAGEQDVPLENKERVEFLKGIAGVESGVASAGGLINYVTKPALRITAMDLATDHRGTSFGSLDLGRLLSNSSSSGIRINLAAENMHTYIEDANGWRGVGAADGSWQLDRSTLLTTDFEYQHRVQRSAAGYQLLGGTEVPAPVYPSVMLGTQSWSKPNTFDVFNTSARLNRTFNSHWSARLAGSYSHSLIDDNVIWPYGAALDSSGNSLCPNSPAYFFCPDGGYEIYDYRSPGELRIDAIGELLLQGHIETGRVSHDLVGGGSLFHRSVYLSPSIVDAPIGTENIYEPNISYAIEEPYQVAGLATLADFNHQSAAILQDRVRVPGGITLLAGGRFARVSDFNYLRPRNLWLPQYAVTFTPARVSNAIGPLSFYANYGVMLSLGEQAPWWVDNGNLFLDPYFTRQTEIGVKYEHRVLLTAALFRMRQPFFYPRVIPGPDTFCTGAVSPGDLCFESSGHETHDGIELSAQGKAASWLQLSASAAAIRALSTETGTSSYDNRQVINVPRLHSTFFADLLVPHAHSFHLTPAWSYTSRKEATRDDTVSVPSFNLFNLGARYSPGGENGRVTFRLYADNVFNKRYWKDTGASYGDTFIHQGAPTTVRLSAHYTF